MCLVYDPNIIGLFAISLDLSQFVVFMAKQPENGFPRQLISVKALPNEGVSPHVAKFDFWIFTTFGLG